jgi:HEAT repeat protein
VDNYKAVERYNRVAKGSNISEWHRRLFDANPNTRLEAVESLGKDGSEGAVKPLLDATSDSDPRVRAKAIDYLGAIGNPRATQVLTQYLFLSDVDRASKQRVLVALGRIADPAAVGPLTAFLGRTGDEELRCGGLYALGEIGDAKGLEVVQSFASSSDPNTKRVAAQAETKINAKMAALPNNQPTIIELERRLRPPEKEEK